MQKERIEGETPKRKHRKRSRFGYYLYAVVMMILTVANIALAVFLLTYVQSVDVKGTKYTKEEQILEWFKEDPYTINSIYSVVKHKFAQPELLPYLESAMVGFQAPWALQIDVEEKKIVGCILHEQSYVYFAEDGTVMLMGNEILDGIPVVEGLQVLRVELYKTLEFDSDQVFSYVTKISEQIKKNELNPDRIVWEEDSMNLYFGEIRVSLGKMNFDEKLIELPPILERLEGKKGTLHLEHYSEMSTNISFEEEKEEN